ncbi:hypothetical protein AVEN_79318-1 [Araneus ventricosus]|uniref:Uncharacterized protein n=1 Tax=Araneus ventricosus TaxID=182803 RepID=A0A4Y2JZA8_ARAVE|nr:hypothetical protein AVEN_79318-1 [Araneus ventricosus]
MEKEKRESASTKPNQSLSRSLIPKINQNLEAERKMSILNRNLRNKMMKLIKAYNGLRPLPQETYLTPKKDPKIKNYGILRKDHIQNGKAVGGVALLYSQRFPSRPYTLDTSLQAVAIQTDIKMFLTICAIYIPPNLTINNIVRFV